MSHHCITRSLICLLFYVIVHTYDDIIKKKKDCFRQFEQIVLVSSQDLKT